MASISETELLDALANARPGAGPAEAQTCIEMTYALGWNERTVRKALHKLHHEGRLVAHTVTRTGIDGRHCRVSAYTIVPKKKGK